jgi:DNA polymerase III alpha subunit (gram-positive type)
MKFIRDILLFDIETTGPDSEKDNIIQLAAVLLDKDNLLEKNFFNSYVRVSLLEGTISQHAQQLNIPFELMQRSPKIYDVVKKFYQHFGNDALLATFNLPKVIFLKNAFRKATILFDYDHHVMELWTLGYIYTLNYGIKKMPTFQTLLTQFRLEQQNRNNALERARLTAEIFRKIIKDV